MNRLRYIGLMFSLGLHIISVDVRLLNSDGANTVRTTDESALDFRPHCLGTRKEYRRGQTEVSLT